MEMRQKLLVDNNVDNILFKEDVHMKECQVEGCSNKHYGKGYCQKHYNQVRKYGKILTRTRKDPNEIIIYDNYAEIVLYDNYGKEINKALIDLDDIEKVKNYKWTFDGRYVRKSGKERLHRFIMNCPKDMVVDHINMNPLDNRKCNLRICTIQQNNFNKKEQTNNTSGRVGVTWDKQTNKWLAQIQVDGKNIKLGRFKNKEEAIRAREEAELKYFGEYKYRRKD